MAAPAKIPDSATDQPKRIPGQRKHYDSPAQDKLAKYGIDRICEDIGEGTSLRAIAEKIDVGIARMLEWIDRDPERAALVRASRSRTAPLWDEAAEEGILAATSAIELGKARELAAHYRWRASKIRPQDYGDKVAVTHAGQVEHRLVSDDEINRRLAQFSGVTIDEDGNVIE